MKAAVLHRTGSPFLIEDVPVPEIGPDEVLIETHTCGICRTDIHIQDGLAYIPDFPHIPGHEPAGVISAVGEQVEGWSVGERVVPHLFVTCGQCRSCRTGRDAQCSNIGGVLGVTRPGGFAEYFKAPARNLVRLPDTVSFESGGLVSCAIVTALHAYRRSRLRVNDVAVVLGAGGIGQILIQILHAAGIRTAAVGRSLPSLESARKAGAELALSLHAPETPAAIKTFSGGEGADSVFECVGTAATMKAASEFARRGGQIIVIGEEPEFPEINTIQIAQRELEIIGSRNGSVQDAIDATHMLASGLLAPPIAGRFPLDGLNEAIKLMRSGRANGRVIISVKE